MVMIMRVMINDVDDYNNDNDVEEWMRPNLFTKHVLYYEDIIHSHSYLFDAWQRECGSVIMMVIVMIRVILWMMMAIIMIIITIT